LLKIIAFTEILLCIFYILKTGSLGTFLAAIIAVAFALVFAMTHADSLNTHNAYTQISSECGIPAFIRYMATLILTIKLNYRMYKSFSKLPQIDGRLTGIAFSGFIGGIAYVVASTFHHIGYGVSLPWMGGETIALWLATQPMLSGISCAIPRIPVSARSETSRS
jgi:hypothetical protein